jgi:hypothetical protein
MTNLPHRSCRAVHAPDWMVIDAVRYAMGRRSYQVGITAQWVRCSWHLLSDHTQQIIKQDIEDEFQRAERTGDYSDLGDSCDRREWEDVRALWKPKPQSEEP